MACERCKELEAKLEALREAISGWEGYAWKNRQYIDDVGEYFAKLKELQPQPVTLKVDKLDLKPATDLAGFQKALEGKVLDSAKTTGYYGR